MLTSKLFSIFIVLEIMTLCSGYRILAIYLYQGISGFKTMFEILKGLAKQGHQVDLINVFPENEKVPNLTQIITLSTGSVKSLSSYSFVKNPYIGFDKIKHIGIDICENLGHPEVFNLINNPPKDPPYDAVITQMRFYHCFLIVGHYWNVPAILIASTRLYPWMHDMIGNPENIAFSPNGLMTIPDENLVESLWTRICNAYWNYASKFLYYYATKDQTTIIQKYFGPDAPSVRELEKNVSLVLTNTHFSINEANPTATNLIEIGGIHIKDDGPELSHTLKKWLDESKDGVIYFNFGSRYRIEIFPEETVRIIFESLEKVAPVRVLMKVNKPEDLNIKIPSNFYTLSWIPQEKVLQHPNIKFLVTHGGLLSTQEAVYYGVPMLCLPLVADQSSNSINYVRLKVAVKVDILSLTQEEFESSLNEILKNPIYYKNIKRLSERFLDRPQSPMETAIYWIEYVIRNGKNSLRSPIMDLTWWQVALLDVYAVMILGILIIILTVVYIVRNIINFIRSRLRFLVTKQKKS